VLAFENFHLLSLGGAAQASALQNSQNTQFTMQNECGADF